jgi:hypothetical protein
MKASSLAASKASSRSDGRKRLTQSGRAQTVAWRDDIVIRERLDEVARLWASGKSVTASVPLLNAWLTSKGYPEITRTTLGEDRKRLTILAREAYPMAQEEHSEKMRHLTERLYDRLNAGACPTCGHGPMAEQAEAQMWSVLQRALAEYAKVDGAVVTRIETRIERTAAEAVKILVLQVLPEHGVREDTILALLDDPRVRELEVSNEPQV